MSICEKILERYKENRVDTGAWRTANEINLNDTTVSIYDLKRNMTTDNFTLLLNDYLNYDAKSYSEGIQIGLRLRNTHRTLQGQLFNFCIGIIQGLSYTNYADDRNEQAIKSGKIISEMVKDGRIPLQRYI